MKCTYLRKTCMSRALVVRSMDLIRTLAFGVKAELISLRGLKLNIADTILFVTD